MSAVGRNDPCPCGSGKKFKRCCLGASVGAVGAYTPGERQDALNALFRFAGRAEFAEDRVVADAAFWADRLDDLTDEDAERALDLDQSQAAFQEWFALDFQLESGRAPVDLFLERHGDRLRAGELRYLERLRRTSIRPYEVAAVRLDEGLDLVDLWAKKRVRVRERVGTRQIVQWDVLAARIMLGPGGGPIIEGAPYLYRPSAKEAIVKALRRAQRELTRRFPDEAEAARFKRAGMIFHLLWLDHVALRPLPKIVTAEGDEMVLARVVFDVKDPGAVDAALASHPDLARQDDGSYVWLQNADGFQRSLGVVVPEGARLAFEATSRPRAERGRAMIEALGGDAVVHRATRYESVEQALRRRPAKAARGSEVPPEVEAQVVGQYYEAHYRKWIDEPLPALGGRTPREAARLKSARPKLVSLLKAMEHGSTRQRREGRPAYDFGWMWEELGLPRPG